MKKRDLLFCLSFACMLPLHIYGARPIDTQAQLDRAREQQLAREARLGEGRITVQTGGLDSTSGSLSSRWLYSTGTTASTCRTIFFCISNTYC